MTIATPFDLQQAAPDAHIWASNIMAAKAIKNKAAPVEVDLAMMITQIQIVGSIKGTDSIVLTIIDPDWKLMDSGFWDLDEDGKLDLIDINYPDGSRFWWRMTQISPQSGFLMDLTFVDLIAAELMTIFGPVKSNRAGHTRAEFLASLAAKATLPQSVDFHSLELDIVQAIASSPVAKGTASSTAQAGSGASAGGFWQVPASAESDPAGTGSAFGHIPAGGRGYSILSKSGTSSDAGTAGQAISPFLPGGTVMIIVNPANGKSVNVPLIDRGAGSDGILPVVGIYPQTQADLGLSGGSFTVNIKLASGSPITCARGHTI